MNYLCDSHGMRMLQGIKWDPGCTAGKYAYGATLICGQTKVPIIANC